MKTKVVQHVPEIKQSLPSLTETITDTFGSQLLSKTFDIFIFLKLFHFCLSCGNGASCTTSLYSPWKVGIGEEVACNTGCYRRRSPVTPGVTGDFTDPNFPRTAGGIPTIYLLSL